MAKSIIRGVSITDLVTILISLHQCTEYVDLEFDRIGNTVRVIGVFGEERIIELEPDPDKVDLKNKDFNKLI